MKSFKNEKSKNEVVKTNIDTSTFLRSVGAPGMAKFFEGAKRYDTRRA